ncbi:very low-density lipoprotein receptor-like [Mya arenaria]|uniref:very low-density lipoprotein receptor-like n=1 Tax=Mya arenaria TaxID=6604 RepID=UPI0022E1BDDD|nr:very low-density lipoprotein receptor-like [Mya arenaria]
MNQLRCPHGQCAVRCDGIPECDMTLELAIDEQNCSCMTGQTRCPNGTCVTPCNETPECNNGDDEAICTCPPGRFTCPDNSCAVQCDENPECADQSDEDRLLCFGDLCRLATNDAECTAYSDKVALCKGGQNGMCDPLTGLVRRSQGGDVFACLCVSSDNDVGPDVCQRLGYSTGAQEDAGPLGEVCTVFRDCRGSALVADCSDTSECPSPAFIASVVCQP